VSLIPKSGNKKKDFELKNWVYGNFISLTQRFDWNQNKEILPIIPMLHGTDNDIAWKVCQTGFASLSTLDAGWYGKGIYFSSSAKYILPYYATKKVPTIIISYIIPGNPYPVTENPQKPENLTGAAPKDAYQSHYVIVSPIGTPPSTEIDHFYDELVINQESQILPLFLLLPSQASIAIYAAKMQRDVLDPYDQNQPGAVGLLGHSVAPGPGLAGSSRKEELKKTGKKKTMMESGEENIYRNL